MASTPYLTLAAFKLQTVMPSEAVDEIEAREPGWTDRQLLIWSAWLDGRLRKRYDAPFVSPFPEIVTLWLSQIVTFKAYLRLGVKSTDEQITDIKAAHDQALADVLEAANSETGLFDLPLRADTTESGLAHPAPMVYSETSPYAHQDVQIQRGTAEDESGNGGTSG